MCRRRVLTDAVESKPNSRMIKTSISGVILMASSIIEKKIARTRKPSRTPSNGLETANQKETFQSEVVEFIFTLFSQAFEDGHFTKREISLRQGIARNIPCLTTKDFPVRDLAKRESPAR